MSYHSSSPPSSPPTFSFSNWTGSITVNASGTITITNGNSTAVTTIQSSFPANTTSGSETLTVDVNVVVPSGYSNSGSTVTGQVTVTQPTSYTPPQPTFNFSDWTGLIAVDASGTITITAGNGATVTTTQSSFPANTTVGNETLTVDVNVIVPVGYSNSNSTVTGQVIVTQPTSYVPPQQPTFNFSDWTGSVSVNAAGTISITNGNATSVTTNPTSFIANTDSKANQVTILVIVTVPSGYDNATATVQDNVTVIQPTSYTPPQPTFNFSDWTGSVSVNAAGTITITAGNGATVTTTQTNFSANTTEGTETLTVDVNVVVPSGYLNSGSTVTGQVTVTQPTSYTPPPPESCPSPIAVNGYYPLYTTITCAQQHTGGNGDYHSHELNGITYYMPNGLNMDSNNGPITQWHGDYLSESEEDTSTSESEEDTSTREGTTSTSIKRGRVPIPKSQEEISQALVGNSNSSSKKLNRGEQVSFRDDATKPFSLGIKDIDEAIFYYFNNIIRPFTLQNNQRIAVPVKYGSPERWKDVQRDGYYRDDKGKIMAPLILLRRSNMVNDNLMYKLDGNKLHNVKYSQKQYTKQNSYTQFDILNNVQPVKEAYAIVVPDFVTITYNCLAYTYYVEQLNKIVESINFAANSYWGDPERFKFKTLIRSYTTAAETPVGENRTVKAEFDLELKGYLIPDVIQKDLISPKKALTVGRLNIMSEITSTEL